MTAKLVMTLYHLGTLQIRLEQLLIVPPSRWWQIKKRIQRRTARDEIQWHYRSQVYQKTKAHKNFSYPGENQYVEWEYFPRWEIVPGSVLNEKQGVVEHTFIKDLLVSI
jgi:hypothetical protein